MIGILCEACVEVLRDAFDPVTNARQPLHRELIDVMPDEKPPPFIGDYFLAVYGSDFSSPLEDANMALHASMSISVTLTMRSTPIPMDQMGRQLYVKRWTGMSSIMWKVMRTLDKNINIFAIIAAHPEFAVLYDEGARAFEFLRWRSTDANPRPAYQEHFSATNEHLEDESGTGIMGYTMTANFGGFRVSNPQFPA